ncbi:protein of unknown function [Mucilaginibacter lappiensis]|uniref:DUF4268 domain-containing protein n=1 Tax=Mucilaginibacter lappiensis TaxID=354630 RepID=A0ABR6PE58_9SPHI|nr:DUF4268 domain-containing protein [Mucilaginibacter lappiensis]MBB6108055.1 hypothetical protein [Mucilaginibacter lappiensis]SIP88506.1 protein of unknown function [Mucilaginibacter lappiensis]
MYSKDEASQIRQAFWTAFGQYIAPQLSADGLRINWINYKTGIKHLNFKMQTGNREAYIAIEISHPDAGMQELMFEQFKELKTVFDTNLNEEWEWEPHTRDENNKLVSRIIKTLPSASIFNRNDWPALISFFKPRIIALDEFWSIAQYSFELFK